MASESSPPESAPESGRWRRSHRAPPLAVRKSADGLTVLSIVHAGEGGTILTNEDLMRALTRRGHACFILHCGPRKWMLQSVAQEISRSEEVNFETEWRTWEAPREDRVAAFEALLGRLEPDVVHIRSFLGCGPEIVQTARRAGCATIVSYHDYAAVCPNIHLLDASLTHCAGVCTVSSIDCSAPVKWFAGMRRLKDGYVHAWRARVSAAFQHADAHVTTSHAAAALLKRRLRHLRWRKVHVVPHGRAGAPSGAGQMPRPDVAAAVVVLGTASAAKGGGLLAALFARNRAAGGPFRFHLLGDRDGAAAQDADVIRHGPYARDDLPRLLREIGPSFALIASPWPETFSHTLTEVWLAGVPALVSDLGAPAERVRRAGGGWRLDPHDPGAWWRTLTRASRDRLEWARKSLEISQMQFRGEGEMAEAYEALYRRCILGRRGVLSA